MTAKTNHHRSLPSGRLCSCGHTVYPACPPAPFPLEPPSRSPCILPWFTESTAEAVAESLLSPTESLPGGTATTAPAPAPSAAALPTAGRGGRAQLRPGQQLRPLLRSYASVQWPPAHLVLWGLQVTFCSPSEAGFGGSWTDQTPRTVSVSMLHPFPEQTCFLLRCHFCLFILNVYYVLLGNNVQNFYMCVCICSV